MNASLIDMPPGEVLTLATGDLEMWRTSDDRFLIHLALTGKRQMWIELSPEQASWLAGQLEPAEANRCTVCGRSNMLSHICEPCYERYVA